MSGEGIIVIVFCLVLFIIFIMPLRKVNNSGDSGGPYYGDSGTGGFPMYDAGYDGTQQHHPDSHHRDHNDSGYEGGWSDDSGSSSDSGGGDSGGGDGGGGE